ncbi:hypothetical protein SLEP1_g55420 [Rubroshorea leprosula]|uniref:SWIM-type domain-containing protein n=1 Tax=Rubroshorea leprosula TaxID=152421 RepID=A0AAV5MJ62_9ROSI|nr:hypothetical protein SLEP1_g55420 [Rubroshorea leprosula]
MGHLRWVEKWAEVQGSWIISPVGSDNDDEERQIVYAQARCFINSFANADVDQQEAGPSRISKLPVKRRMINTEQLQQPSGDAGSTSTRRPEKKMKVKTAEELEKEKEKAAMRVKKYKDISVPAGPLKGHVLTPTKPKRGDPVRNVRELVVDDFDYSETSRDTDYYDSDDFGQLRAFSSSEEEENVFYVAADPPSMGVTDIYYNPNWDVAWFEVGMRFINRIQFREAVRKYSISKRCKLLTIKNEPRRQRYKCAGQFCGWELFASPDAKTDSFQVKTYHRQHRCIRTSDIPMLTQLHVAKYWRERVRDTPFIKVSDMMKTTYSELRVNASFDKCVRAKRMIIKELRGNFKDEYGLMVGYAYYLLSVNPGNSAKIAVDRSNPTKPKFKRFYMCLKVLKDGWKRGCRPYVCVDACFLKGVGKGVLMCAVGRDGNEQMYPVAWAIVGESTNSWEWFFEALRDDLEVGNGENFTIMSDQHKAISAAAQHVFPSANHRWCARHIYYNFAKIDRGDDCKIQCDSIDNNMGETFNSWILQARCKAPITMLNTIMDQCTVRLKEKHESVAKWNGDIAPRIRDKIEANLKLAFHCTQTCNGGTQCKVIDEVTTYTHVVDLKDRTCTCRGWQISRIPCPHLLCSCKSNGWNLEYFIDDYYKKEAYLAAYGTSLECIRGEEARKKYNTEALLPLDMKSLPG